MKHLQYTYIGSVFCADFKFMSFLITSLTIQEKIDQNQAKIDFL